MTDDSYGLWDLAIVDTVVVGPPVGVS